MRRIIDAHSHIGTTIASGVGQDVDTWLARMDAAGIAQAIISVAAGGLQAEGLADTRRANDIVARAVKEYPDRFPIVMWGPNDRLCGLSLVLTSGRAVEVRFRESNRPEPL